MTHEKNDTRKPLRNGPTLVFSSIQFKTVFVGGTTYSSANNKNL